jgi:transcriptional regulator with XRE-family HTH domain
MLNEPSQEAEMSVHLMKMSDKAIGRRIKSARTSAGLGQAEMGRRMGVSNTTAWRWESGKTSVPLPKLRKIAELLKVGMEQLLPPVRLVDAEADTAPADPEEHVHIAQLALAVAREPSNAAAVKRFDDAVMRRARRLLAAKMRHSDKDDDDAGV